MRWIAVVGPTATGKSALSLALAERLGGEIVSCDSTAVYRGIDIGTDKPSAEDRARVPHHHIDVAEPCETYTAARYAVDAAAAVSDIHARGRVPILAGGTGFYFRALRRGLFPGPARDNALRARLNRVADLRGVERLHRWLARVDSASAQRIQPRDRMRLVRALEVFLLTGRALTQHFAETQSPLAGSQCLALGVTMARDALRDRVSRRVDSQFARGVVREVQDLLAAGLPEHAHALSGLVYRQVLELGRGLRSEADTRELIVRENMRYASRQLTWFRHEPGVTWLDGPGESPAVVERALAITTEFLANTAALIHVR